MTCNGKVKKKFSCYNGIVHDYIDKHRNKRKTEMQFYAKLPSLRCSIEISAMAIRSTDGKRHNHQRRIPEKLLQSLKKRLLKKESRLKQVSSFNELIEEVQKTKIKRIGELTIYDTALRIGAHLKKKPDRIYLHAGTKKGALALGMNCKGKKTLKMEEFSKAFQRLKAYEVEDCLCIYKDHFKGISA